MSTTEAILQRVIELLRDLDTSSDTTFEGLKESLEELKSDLPLTSDVTTTSGSLSDQEERPEDQESALDQRITVLENALNNIDPSLNPEADYLSEDPSLQFGEVKTIVAFDDNNFPSPYIEVLPQSPSFEGTAESTNQEMLVPRLGKRMKPMLRVGDVVSYRTDYEQRKILVGPYQYSENTHWAQACADWTNVAGGFDNESYVDCLPAVNRHGSNWIGTQNDPPGAPAVGDLYVAGAVPTGAWTNHAGFFALWVDNWGDGGAWEFSYPTYKAGAPAAKGDWALRVFLPRPGLGGGATTGDPNVREDAVIAYTWVPTTIANAQQYNVSVDEFEVPVCVSDYMDAPIGTIWGVDDRGGAGVLVPLGWENITAAAAGLDARDRAILGVGPSYPFGANNNIFDPIGAGDGFAFHWIRRIN